MLLRLSNRNREKPQPRVGGANTVGRQTIHFRSLLCNVGPKTEPFLEVHNSCIDDKLGKRRIRQNIHLFIRSRSGILNIAVFKYSLHTFRETVLH